MLTSETFIDCARGPYQRELLRGRARWSGADLRGKAAKYSSHYKRSRLALAERVEELATTLGATVRWVGGTAHEGPKKLVVTDAEGHELVLG